VRRVRRRRVPMRMEVMVRESEGGGRVVTVNSVVVKEGLRVCSVGGCENIGGEGRRVARRKLRD